MAAPLKLTRTHRILIGVVVAGAVVIAGIGFAGSYAAVRELAIKKGFGDFSYFFPIGIDAGICVLLALDLLLTWIRMPFSLLRHTAWVLTVATVAFNAAAAGDPLGMAMHAVIPVLFVITVEAARHAVGRIADITADKHMEGVRLTRWLLAPIPTFLLWRRMKLWELRSYDQVIKLEQERLVYQARLRSRFGRAWRRKAPVDSRIPLRLTKYGIPLAETAPAGLAAAGIEPQLMPPAPAESAPGHELKPNASPVPTLERTREATMPDAPVEPETSQWFAPPPHVQQYQGHYDPDYDPSRYEPGPEDHAWYEEQIEQAPQIPVPHPRAAETEPVPVASQEPQRQTPKGTGGTQPLGKGVQEALPPDEEPYQVFRYSRGGEGMPTPSDFASSTRVPADPAPPKLDAGAPSPTSTPAVQPEREPRTEPEPESATETEAEQRRRGGIVASTGATRAEAIYAVFASLTDQAGKYPSMPALSKVLFDEHGITGQKGRPMSAESLRRYRTEWMSRYERETTGLDS